MNELSSRVPAALALLAPGAPTEATRAGMALDRLLEGVRRSRWGSVAWEASRLTWDGFPLEFSFASGDSRIRYVAEVAAPERPLRTRLADALDFLRADGVDHVDDFVSTLVRLQSGQPLAYGAWVGGRHGKTTDTYKLYAEVPCACDTEAMRFARQRVPETADLPPTAEFRLVGWEPDTGRLELYYRVPDLSGDRLHRHLLGSGVPILEDVFTKRRRMAYFSLTVDGTGLRSLALFVHGRSMGDDAEVRRRVLQLSAEMGVVLTGYAGFSAVCSTGRVVPPRHGPVTVVSAVSGAHGFGVGIAPPR